MEVLIITSNIRFSTHDDGPQAWPERKEILANLLLSHSPLIIGTQEGRQPQLQELDDLLPDYKLCDLHRNWIQERMYPCLFFDTTRAELLDSGDFWLSETPFVDGSLSFGSMFPRLCTWIYLKFQDQSFYVFNTHLDHVKDSTRQAQIKVLSNQIKMINKENAPMIVMGDFNDSPQSLTRKIIEKELPQLQDDWKGKEESTHHPFTGELVEGDRIDWILHSFSQEIDIKLEKRSHNNIWPSDHFPVIGKFKF